MPKFELVYTERRKINGKSFRDAANKYFKKYKQLPESVSGNYVWDYCKSCSKVLFTEDQCISTIDGYSICMECVKLNA